MEDYNKALVKNDMVKNKFREEYYLSIMKGRAKVIAMEKFRKNKLTASEQVEKYDD